MLKRKAALFFLLFALILTCVFYIFLTSELPASFSIIEDNEAILSMYFPFELYISGDGDSRIEVNGRQLDKEGIRISSRTPLKIRGESIGESRLNIKLFGLIPLRSMKLNILPDIRVFPGGQSIGVLMRSKGVIVVRESFVDDTTGKRCYPAREAGIEVGDIILKINGKPVEGKEELAALIQDFARESSKISLTVKKKNGDLKQLKLSPVKTREGIFMIGLYVDDGIAGVGTLTFYDPESREYGALGHVIKETGSQVKITVAEGNIVEAQISGINIGRTGYPGEKRGTFYNAHNVLGSIEKNTDYGIFGKLQKSPENPFFSEPVPVATINRVKSGPARMYTVVKGGKIEEYRINIDRVYHQSIPGSKGMVFSISDTRLKQETGGIIQGMSGSPIVQQGRLVGAVTHVFVNNPLRGYGVFAEWMLRETGIYGQTDSGKAIAR